MKKQPLFNSHHPGNKKFHFGRWGVLLAISILFHVLFFFGWNLNPINVVTSPLPEPTVISTQLLVDTPRQPATPPQVPAHAIKPARQTPPLRSAVTATESTIEKDAVTESESSLAGMEVPGTSLEPASPIVAIDQPEPQPTVAVDPSPKKTEEKNLRHKVAPPPSAELQYEVQGMREGQSVYGHGSIRWQSNGLNYTIQGDAGILLFTLLRFKSEGKIDESGVAPVIYSEKRFRRSETNTHFHRERSLISFSASTATYPRQGGEQDRASIIWQLAAIGRGDSGQFHPDVDIPLFVAGTRDAEIWHIRVVGQEEIGTGIGTMRTWHVVRTPRKGSYDQKLDIWLAPQQEWYPVRLRYTEVNGDYLDLLLSNVDSTTGHKLTPE